MSTERGPKGALDAPHDDRRERRKPQWLRRLSRQIDEFVQSRLRRP